MIPAIRIIKRIDSIFGPLLLKILPKDAKQNIKISNPQKILIIRPGGMGDAILLLPALKAILKKHHTIKIDVLCEKRNQNVFEAVSYINRICSYTNLKEMIHILNTPYDIVIDTEQSHFLSAIITRMTKATLKSGFRTNGRQKLYSVSIHYHHDRYEAKSFQDLISDTLSIPGHFSWDLPYFKQTKQVLPERLAPKKYICLFPGATINERLWPEERWAKIIDWLSDKEWICVLLGGKKEISQCQTIAKLCNSKYIVNLCCQLTIGETSFILNQSSLLISTDSGILHLGVLCDIPTISLFGSGIAAKWAPKGKKHFIIDKKLTCSPCTKFGTTPPCPNHFKCMMQIDPNDVVNAIQTLLTQ